MQLSNLITYCIIINIAIKNQPCIFHVGISKIAYFTKQYWSTKVKAIYEVQPNTLPSLGGK